MIFGFFVMGILAYRTYTASMPLPDKVVTESGQVLFTGQQITRGQELFQARGLQEYGSVLGHGAYLGPDFTAEYLRMATDDVADQFRAEGVADPRDRVVTEFRTNRYNPDTKTVVFTNRQAKAFDNIRQHYATYFGENSTKYGLLPNAITDSRRHPRPDRVLRVDGVGVGRRASRPQLQLHQQLAGRAARRQRSDRVRWSCGRCCRWSHCSAAPASCSRVYGRWSQKVGWQSAEAPTLSFRQPGEVRADARAARVDLVLRDRVGAVPGADPGRRRGRALPGRLVDVLRPGPGPAAAVQPRPHLARPAGVVLDGGGLPRRRNLLDAVHRRREPRRQSWLVYGLLGAVALVVFGSLITEALSIYGVTPGGIAVLAAVGIP